jgi:hypothetical protein
VHCWLIWRKAHEAASDYLYRGIAETGISDTDFRVLEVLLYKGPLPVNTIGPKVHLTPGSISVAVDRLRLDGDTPIELTVPEEEHPAASMVITAIAAPAEPRRSRIGPPDHSHSCSA